MKKGLLYSFIIFGLLSSTTQVSAKEVDNSLTISSTYVDIEKTKDVLKETEVYLNDYMKQKLSMYNVFVVNEGIYKIPKYDYKSKRVIGLINYGDNEILVSGDCDSEKRKKTLLHELGHVIDCWDSLDNYRVKSLTKHSGTIEFQNIFKLECSSLNKYTNEDYFKTDSKEFFAESFALYIMNPEVVKNNTPMLFKYMEKISQLKPMSGWQLNKDKSWYYLADNQYKVGWFKDKDGKWYYFSVYGEMMTKVDIDGYTLGHDGVMMSK